MRGRRFALIAGVGALLALGGAVWGLREEIEAWRRSLTVRDLLDPAKRAAVWQEIVRWQRYATPGTAYRVNTGSQGQEAPSEVVLCNPGWRPVYAVFLDTTHKGQRRFELVRFDGAFLTPAMYWNCTRKPFRDLNGDGVLERVEDGIVYVDRKNQRPVGLFQVISLTEDQETILAVAYREWKGGSRREVVETGRKGFPDVVLEQKDPEAAAVYRWSEERGCYEGPPGSLEGEFLRLECLDWDLLRRFSEGRGGE